ncbi:MAG: 30S ribosomal protein S6, partial [Saprospiraceae bacterium]
QANVMRHYELTFIVDPVLSNEDIQIVKQTYEDQVKKLGCNIVHIDELGLKQLAYPLNKRNSGIYYTIEFEAENGEAIAPLELALRRDERIMRFLSIALDKFGVKYNEDKRNGLIRKTQRMRRKINKPDSVPMPTPVAAPAAKPVEVLVPDVVAQEEE